MALKWDADGFPGAVTSMNISREARRIRDNYPDNHLTLEATNAFSRMLYEIMAAVCDAQPGFGRGEMRLSRDLIAEVGKLADAMEAERLARARREREIFTTLPPLSDDDGRVVAFPSRVPD